MNNIIPAFQSPDSYGYEVAGHGHLLLEGEGSNLGIVLAWFFPRPQGTHQAHQITRHRNLGYSHRFITTVLLYFYIHVHVQLEELAPESNL